MTRALAILLLLGLGGLGSPAGAADVGQPVPDFSAQTSEGRTFRLGEALRSHRAVAVVFLSTVCPYARSFGTHLQDLEDRYGDRGLLVLGVNSNSTESVEEVAADARRRGYRFGIVKDVDHSIADRLGAHVTPESFLIDVGGDLRYRGRVKSKLGAADLESAVAAVLAGREVKTPVAKAFGCAIQRD